MIEDKQKEFEELVKPVMKWLAENQNPHTKIIVEANCAEIIEGTMIFSTDEYLVD